VKKRAVVLTTDAHRPAFDDFADAMRAAESNEGWRSSEVLRNFLEAAYFAVRGRFLLGEVWKANEADYMRIVETCRKPSETMGALAKMLAATTRALLTEPVDFIGPVFSELSADAGMGQFFTPYSLSYMMAKMTLGDDPRSMIGEKGYVSMMEPACGVGGMILATNVALREAGFDVAREVHWTAVDVDRRAFCACYLQLALTDVSADVYRGNSLGPLENLVGCRTPAAMFFPKRLPSDGAARPVPLEVEPPAAVAGPNPEPPLQLNLF